jgi:hypothetical protein
MMDGEESAPQPDLLPQEGGQFEMKNASDWLGPSRESFWKAGGSLPPSTTPQFLRYREVRYRASFNSMH